MKHFLFTEPGEGHQNEDVALVKKLTGSDLARFCALADGQGGQAGGALAAQLAVNTAIGSFSPELNPDWLKAEFWYLLVSHVDELIAEFADAGFTVRAVRPLPLGMGI
jgi:serine/threonine protein phosphatase PrpC